MEMSGGVDKAHTCELINSAVYGLIDYGQLTAGVRLCAVICHSLTS